jgi:hypothetical protein
LGIHFRLFLATTGLVGLMLLPGEGEAIPYYARKYDTRCKTCHIIPPKLNQTGEDFLARGYRFRGEVPTRRTVPLSVWSTWRGEYNLSRERGRGLPNRVEIISGGALGKTRGFYFVEWLPVSQQVGGSNQRVQRHGRFEDIFVGLPVGPLFVTVGQFRAMSQVDVSRRLSLSEALAFSTSVAGRPALSSRLTGLRGFSLSGRSPAVRVSHQWATERNAADGWYNSATVPFAGEFVIPLNSTVRRAQGFGFEFRPKGVLLESYYRYGMQSFGGHAFVGSDRRLLGLVGSVRRGPLFSTLALGFAKEISGAEDTRVSWETEYVPWGWLSVGLRVDDRSGANRPAALLPHVNVQFPLTKYVVRATIEHRQQHGNRQWLLELGTVF